MGTCSSHPRFQFVGKLPIYVNEISARPADSKPATRAKKEDEFEVSLDQKRIFIGTTEVAGVGYALKEGFDKFPNIETTYVDLQANVYAYSSRSSFLANRFYRQFNRVYSKSPAVLGPLLIFFRFLFSLGLFFWALPRHDVFIFLAGSSFCFYFDYLIIRLLGKEILTLHLGSDSRPPYLNGVKVEASKSSLVKLFLQTIKRKLTIALINKLANVIIDSPVTGHFHTRPFLNIGPIGVPVIPPNLETDDKDNKNTNKIRILHCPSRPKIKGSAFIQKCMSELKSEGFPVDYVELTGLPNSQVLKEIAKCDFVVDEVYSDVYMGVFAAEAAWFSKPSVSSGYAKDTWDRVLPDNLRAPALYVHPDDLYDGIRLLCINKDKRKRIGEAAFDFISTHQSPQNVAARFLRVIDNKIPKDWWITPDSLDYIHGYGLNQVDSKLIIAKAIRRFGTNFLCINDKPKLLKQILKETVNLI